MPNVTINFSYEVLDELMKDQLSDNCRILKRNVDDYINRGNLKDYQKEDLFADIKYLAAFKTALKYYTTEEERVEKYSDIFPEEVK